MPLIYRRSTQLFVCLTWFACRKVRILTFETFDTKVLWIAASCSNRSQVPIQCQLKFNPLKFKGWMDGWSFHSLHLTGPGASSCQTSDNYSHLAIKTVHRCGMVVDPGTSMFIILKLNTLANRGKVAAAIPIAFLLALSRRDLLVPAMALKTRIFAGGRLRCLPISSKLPTICRVYRAQSIRPWLNVTIVVIHSLPARCRQLIRHLRFPVVLLPQLHPDLPECTNKRVGPYVSASATLASFQSATRR
ncbi:3-oxoacyl-[acyl-carrier-protein] synthase [Trichinella spiralis]|uniref:3-oxoacyl-[acyl-carrier-protein] synthase n=1 Tax=Trichinella spiralis TaxID=6334 RepID=A0ABR3KYI8_TRISP